VSPAEIKALRKAFGMTQEAFAAMLGLSFVSINKWENKASAPTGLSAVMLELLQGVSRTIPVRKVRAQLEACEGSPIDVIRTLTKLERADA
jgi:transcriptional regulator with XRE-family HTH domain